MSMLHQASCVAIDGRAVLIEGPPGSGKSSLALALIDRGAELVGDDGVRLESRGSSLWALPPPNIEGLIEVRNVGLLTLPARPAAIALVIALDPEAERLPDAAEKTERAGISVPLIRLWPGGHAMPLRAERALEIHGLR